MSELFILASGYTRTIENEEGREQNAKKNLLYSIKPTGSIRLTFQWLPDYCVSAKTIKDKVEKADRRQQKQFILDTLLPHKWCTHSERGQAESGIVAHGKRNV